MTNHDLDIVVERRQQVHQAFTCGAGFIMSSKNRLGCFGARDQGRCDNHLTIRRDEVEARVLRALPDKLLRQDLFEEFCDEFTREMNRLRMEQRARPHRRHRPDADPGRTSNRAERESGGDAWGRPKMRRGRQKRATSRCKFKWLRGHTSDCTADFVGWRRK